MGAGRWLFDCHVVWGVGEAAAGARGAAAAGWPGWPGRPAALPACLTSTHAVEPPPSPLTVLLPGAGEAEPRPPGQPAAARRPGGGPLLRRLLPGGCCWRRVLGRVLLPATAPQLAPPRCAPAAGVLTPTAPPRLHPFPCSPPAPADGRAARGGGHRRQHVPRAGRGARGGGAGGGAHPHQPAAVPGGCLDVRCMFRVREAAQAAGDGAVLGKLLQHQVSLLGGRL